MCVREREREREREKQRDVFPYQERRSTSTHTVNKGGMEEGEDLLHMAYSVCIILCCFNTMYLHLIIQH